MDDHHENPVLTVGHSARGAGVLLAVLRAHDIARVVDVRSWPSSKRFPHFDREVLQADLGRTGIGYVWEKALGGKRRSQPGDEVHSAIREPALRAYVEHLHGPEAGAAIARLLGWARERRTAVLCAERDPCQCHRRLLADRLVRLHGMHVVHVIDEAESFPHRASELLEERDGRLVYAGPEQLRLL